MDLDHDACYRAIELRDARFDGRFFTPVKTTRTYCRPICPARTPRSENVTFYPTAAAAQEAGFRPCLRCRPETAPDAGAWRGTSNTVSRALALIELGALDVGRVVALADRLGVGALLLVYTVSGFGFGMRIAQLSTIPADVFAGPHLGAILGVVQAGGGLGGAIGPFLGGWLFDVTGSYLLAFLAAAVAVAGSAVAAWFAARPSRRATADTAGS